MLIFTACSKPPEACIDNGQTSVSTGQEVVFTSCSKRALSYLWTMVGPTGAPENTQAWSDQQIKVIFTIPGTYTVTLEAYSKFSWMGDVGTASQTVTVQ
ncbi:MAG: PKD domain-containing protein [Crocinitomicaceae bacterium]|nr:PKD domain-containing protein [Crocinitomicaceae bacterium]